MTSSQLFDPVQLQYGNSRARGMKITCGKCSNASKVPMNSMRGVPEHDGDHRTDQIVARKFTNEGWRVANTPGKHRCPACLKAETEAKPFAKLEKIKEATVPTAATVNGHAEPPREMLREDRRLIFEKLNEVYADETTGYSGDWTDKRVAADLGVPLAWVTKMREENCGPEGGNAAMRDEIEAARHAIETGKKFLTEIAELKTKVTSLERSAEPMRSLIDKTERTIAGIEKAVRP